MRTEQTNYVQKAERMAYMMDLEEQAARAAKSVWQADDAESRLASLRQEAESLLCMWRKERQDIENKIVKTDREYWSVMQVDAPWSPVLKKVMASLAYKEGKISKEECSAREGIGRKILRIKNDLQQLSYDLEDAIDYLEGYLYPSSSQEENASQVADVPFASNFGVIAQSPAGTLQTPKQIALDYMSEILKQEGDTMYNEFKRDVKGDVQEAIKEMSADTCWDLIDDALYRLENIVGMPLNMAAIDELEKEWREYPQVSRDFRYVVEMVKEWFLYW